MALPHRRPARYSAMADMDGDYLRYRVLVPSLGTMNWDGSPGAESSSKPSRQMVARVKSIRNQSEIVSDSLHHMTASVNVSLITTVSVKHIERTH